MGCLGSPVEKIQNLHFSDWKKVLKHGKKKSIRIVRVEGLLLIQDDAGKLACNDVKQFAYGLGNWGFARNLMSALVSFGIITQQEASKHLDACTKREISSEAKYDLEEFTKLVNKYNPPHVFKNTKGSLSLSTNEMAIVISQVQKSGVLTGTTI